MKFHSEIYSFYCQACKTYVLESSKHCKQCNRCTYEFDHHCFWINNDIGLHNYASFLRMLVCLFITLVSQMVFEVYAIWFAFSIENRKVGGAIQEANVGFMAKNDFLILNSITCFTIGIIIIFDCYLFIFHLYLISKNITTYKYIRRKQRRVESRIVQKVYE